MVKWSAHHEPRRQSLTGPSSVFVATHDLAGQTRGRAVPMSSHDKVLTTGTGWVPANLGITAFGSIAPGIPFGSTGDLRLMPDKATQIEMPGDDHRPGMLLYLADQTELDGSPWDCCPRTFLRRALDDLRTSTGLDVVASFEHEFMLDVVAAAPFSLQRHRVAEPFGSDLLTLLESTGLQPENWLAEYGAGQFEVTVAPASGLTAADRAVLLRDLVRDLAVRHGHHATFAPVSEPGATGNGVHIHLSLQDGQGRPVLYEPDRAGSLSAVGAQFSAGILRHAAAVSAFTASSPISFLRLKPHRWSVGGVFLGERNREALVRISPTTTVGGQSEGTQFNLEYRAADATANPWIALGVLVRAGLEGITGGYPEPTVWPESATETELDGVPALPESLSDALAAVEADDAVRSWFHPDLLTTYLAVKRSEIAAVADLSEAEQVARVRDVY